MNRVVAVVAILLCLSLVGATPAYDQIVALKNRVIDEANHVATYSADTIRNSVVSKMLEQVTNNKVIVIDYVNWTILQDPNPEFVVWGEAHLFGEVKVNVVIDVTIDQVTSQISGALTVDISGGWTTRTAIGHLLPAESYLDSMDMGKATIHLEADTTARLYIKATAVGVVGDDLLGLKRLVGPMSEMEFRIEFTIDLKGQDKTDMKIFLGVNVPLNGDASIQGGSIAVHVLGLNKLPDEIDIALQLVAQFSTASGPVTWGVEGDWTQDIKQLHFTGGLITAWPAPVAKATWLKSIDVLNVEGYVTFQDVKAKLVSLVMTGAATIESKTAKLQPKLVGHLNDDCTDWAVSLSVDMDITPVSQLARIIAGREDASPLPFDDVVHRVHGQAFVDISTYVHQEDTRLVHRGVQLGADVVVTADSPLYKRLVTFFRAAGELQDIVFTFELIVPVFDALPEGISFEMKCSDIALKPNLKMTGLVLTLTVKETDTEIDISTGLSVLFKRQPDWIVFAVQGGIATDGTVDLKGGMLGTLHDLFGMTGLDLSDCWIEIGFIPPAGLDRIGLGGALQIGETRIQLDGLVPIDQPDNLFLYAELDHFKFSDIIAAWNKMDPKHPIDPSKLPEVFDIDYAKFYFAPTDAEVDIGDHVMVHFRAGFIIGGNVTIMGYDRVQFEVRLDLDKKPVDVCFQFDMHFKDALDTFSRSTLSMFDSVPVFHPPEVDSYSPAELTSYVRHISDQLPQILALEVDPICTSAIWAGANVTGTITILSQGQVYDIPFSIPLKKLVTNLAHLIEELWIDIKKWIHNTDCVINANCAHSSKGPMCVHKATGWTCGKCDASSGRVPVFGCVSCLCSAECVYAGSAGSCCDHGACKAPRSGDFCGLCWFGQKCNVPQSGCEFGFCHKCNSSAECYWSGSAGKHCRDGQCTP